MTRKTIHILELVNSTVTLTVHEIELVGQALDQQYSVLVLDEVLDVNKIAVDYRNARIKRIERSKVNGRNYGYYNDIPHKRGRAKK